MLSKQLFKSKFFYWRALTPLVYTQSHRVMVRFMQKPFEKPFERIAAAVSPLPPPLWTALFYKKRASVLIPVVKTPQEATVLFTRRALTLPSHAGEISFPGGRVEKHDVSPQDTALRETQEEIGLKRKYVQVVGFLDPCPSRQGLSILPIVGFVRPKFSLTLNPYEVAETFEVPLNFLMDAAHHTRCYGFWRGHPVSWYEMNFHNWCIWGATASMVRNLYERAFCGRAKTSREA